MQELTINEKFLEYLPELNHQENSFLEESIKKEGCRDPLVVWSGIIVDGHNRYRICKKHNIEFKIIEKEFANEQEAIQWICFNALAKRNLTAKNYSFYRGKYYEGKKKTHAEAGATKSNGKNYHGSTTSQQIADELGVSEKTIRNDAEFAQAVELFEPQIKKQILNGSIKASKKKIKEANGDKTKLRKESVIETNNQDGKEVEQSKTNQVTDAESYVKMAIRQLQRIRNDDPEKLKWLNYIKNWITKQINEVKK